MKVIFIGATSEVTGSLTLIQSHEHFFLVDAGLQQGRTSLEKAQNIQSEWIKKVPVKKLKGVFLTHAHLDHCGLLPWLVKKGLHCPIYATAPTLKLAKIILENATALQGKDQSSTSEVQWDETHTQACFNLMRPLPLDQTHEIADVSVHFSFAGHILGAAHILVKDKVSEKTALFSGDLGRFHDPLLDPPSFVSEALDLVVMESTYGDRLHPEEIQNELLSFAVQIFLENRLGLVASFSIARAQSLIYILEKFFQDHPEYRVPVYIDGPLLMKANAITIKEARAFKNAQSLIEALQKAKPVRSQKERQWLQKKSGPLLILSSSGMLEGGPVMSYLKGLSHRTDTSLFLAGYQAAGTLGAQFSQGQRSFHQQNKNYNWSGDVVAAQSLSSHADQAELIRWVNEIHHPKHIALIHGEPKSKETLAQKLTEQGYHVICPQVYEEIDLTTTSTFKV
jgi:metallo-beta-lactamase family protein